MKMKKQTKKNKGKKREETKNHILQKKNPKQEQPRTNSTSLISTEIAAGQIQERTEGLKRYMLQGFSFQRLTVM